MAVGELFKTARSIVVNQSTTIHNIVAILIVYGFEALVSNTKLFDCPSEGHASYGWAFIFGPAAILFFISMLVRDDFRKVVQGCCHRDAAEGTYCPCTCLPRWCGGKKLIEIILQSVIAGCVWIFWAFFQKEYYTCAVLGKKASKFNETLTAAEKKQIEDEYTKANDTSQYISLVFMGVLLGLSLVFLTIYYCCYQRAYSSLPKPRKYHKLEAQAAVEAFKEKMEHFAQNEGKRQAEMYFSQNPADVLIQAYNELREVDGYSTVFPDDNNTKAIEAQAAREAFDARVETAGKDKAAVTYMDKTLRNVQHVFNAIVSQYPRSNGDRGKPYKKPTSQHGDATPVALSKVNQRGNRGFSSVA